MSETLLSALNSIKINKLRAFLTMLGVIIGVFAVVSMLSLGTGVQNFITDRFSSLGTNLILVSPGRVNFRADPANSYSRNKLETKHVDLINRYAGSQILGVTPSVRSGELLKYKNKEFFGTIVGVNTEGEFISSLVLSKGRFFNSVEQKSKRKVAIIGAEAKTELFGDSNPIGQLVKIGQDSYTIIGILEPKNRAYDSGVTVPYTSAKATLQIENFSSIAVKLRDDADVDRTKKIIEIALLRDMDEDDFTVLAQTELLESFNNILRLLTAGLGLIAGISLVVGGIGIMNIMLVSVTERTKEIGLRKALGATPNTITLQFLTESVVISVSGGIIGTSLAYLLTFGIQSFIRATVPLYAVVIAFLFSVTIGILFGTYPAVKAGKKDPIKALTYE